MRRPVVFSPRPMKLYFAEGPGDWIELMPQVNIEELDGPDGRDRLITIKGVYRLQGSGPETFTVSRFV